MISKITILKVAEYIENVYIDAKNAIKIAKEIRKYAESNEFNQRQHYDDIIIEQVRSIMRSTHDIHMNILFVSKSSNTITEEDLFNSIQMISPNMLHISKFLPVSVLGIRQYYMKILRELPKDEIVIDLSDCTGGYTETLLYLLSHFFPKDHKLFTSKMKYKTVEFFAVDIAPYNKCNAIHKYNGKVHIIVSKNSASAAEIFAQVMKKYDRAKIYGEKTLGTVRGFSYFVIDGLVLHVPSLDIEIDNENIEKIGVIPHYTTESVEYNKLIQRSTIAQHELYGKVKYL